MIELLGFWLGCLLIITVAVLGESEMGHGTCCTCQRCKLHYDDCRCDLDESIAELDSLRAEVEKLRERKDGAYLERNRVVAALAKCFPSGTARTAIEGWSEDWHGCVYIDLPTGQVSWHFNDAHAELFADLPPYPGAWDGHDTDEKYRRLAALAGHPEVEQLRADVVFAVLQGVWVADGPETFVEYDGTDAGLLDAVRRAREGE